MNLSVFQIINYTLILALVIIIVRYLWIVFVIRDDQPAEWLYAVKNGEISSLLKRCKRNYPDKVRFFNWWFHVERIKRENIPGVIVELGVYKGDSARIIHHMAPDRPFHLFDTFSGFTAKDLQVETGEAATYTTTNFADTTVQSVLKRINGNDNIILHPGYFPESAAAFSHQVAFVNMDADLYNPTKAGLELFYPLLSPGGIIMVHDYNHKWPGIIKAVDNFVKTIPESLVFVADTNGTVMIIRNK